MKTIKYKMLSNGTLCTCDGNGHTYHKDVVGQPNTAICWCSKMDAELSARWYATEKEARENAPQIKSTRTTEKRGQS